MVVAVAVLAGIAAGIALAVAREALDRSVHEKRTLEETFGRVVLAEIPRI
jgi:capsular polysaccharide biosynthesis protein